jgi:hypothetical protein
MLLTMSGIQVKLCLPPSRLSLTSYALETRGALRMIRVMSSQMTYASWSGAWVYLYCLELATWALRSNRLKKRHRCNPEVGGGTTIAIGRLIEGPTGHRPTGGADRPHMLPPRGWLQWRASWSLPKHSHVGFAVELRYYIRQVGLPWWFSGYTL